MIDSSEFDRLAASLDDWTGEAIAHATPAALVRMADAAADGIRAKAPRRTGATAAAVDVSASGSGDDARAEITIGRVGKILVHGTQPHEIGPSSRALPIAPYGFASAVHHPGTTPDPFVARGLAAAGAAIDSIATDVAADVADAIAQRITEG
jgi:hypothetical protein